jgi:hypothetical protein
MPHGVLAALTVAMPLIEKLLPIIEKFIDMLSSSSTNYNNGNESLDQYLKDANSALQAAKDNADNDGISGNEFTLKHEIKTAQDAKDVAAFLQKLLDKPGAVSAADRPKMQETITALLKAADELTAQGKVGDTSPTHESIIEFKHQGLSPLPGSVVTPDMA